MQLTSMSTAPPPLGYPPEPAYASPISVAALLSGAAAVFTGLWAIAVLVSPAGTELGGYAVVSLAPLLGVLVALVGIVAAIVAAKRGESQWMAFTGLACGLLAVAAWLATVVAIASAAWL